MTQILESSQGQQTGHVWLYSHKTVSVDTEVFISNNFHVS